MGRSVMEETAALGDALSVLVILPSLLGQFRVTESL